MRAQRENPMPYSVRDVRLILRTNLTLHADEYLQLKLIQLYSVFTRNFQFDFSNLFHAVLLCVIFLAMKR